MVNCYSFFARYARSRYMVLMLLYVAHLNSNSIFTLKCIVVTAIVLYTTYTFAFIYTTEQRCLMTIRDDDGNHDNDDNDNDICNE